MISDSETAPPWCCQYNKGRHPLYKEPTPEQIDAQRLIAMRLADELLARAYPPSPERVHGPSPGWNFGIGNSGVIE